MPASPIRTVPAPLTTTPPCDDLSPILAAGLPLIKTDEDPPDILSGGPTHTIESPWRAAGSPSMNTFEEPLAIGPPTWDFLRVFLGQMW